jgi:uncharacterized membrane protein YsdA (DUF1294 family)
MKLGYFCYFLLALAAVGCVFLPYSLAMWFLLANVLTWLIYGIDKLAARKAWSRVPESTLLTFGLLGGWPGAMVGQRCFRHKTQKQPFRTYFFISIVLNIVVLVGGYWWYIDFMGQ